VAVNPHGPRVFRGALVTIASGAAMPTVIAFQYNPSTLRRRLQPQMAGAEEGDRSTAVRFMGAPVQMIEVEVEIDATDGLEQNDPTTIQYGIQPQLAALELLAYPTVADIQSRQQLLNGGTIEIAPLTAPETLFVWGARRVVPVRIESFTITEEAFDGQLNPIRATVALEMRLLNYSDLSVSTDGYHQFMAYQQKMEAIEGLSFTPSPTSVIGVDVG
jgi:hypothetical protein